MPVLFRYFTLAMESNFYSPFSGPDGVIAPASSKTSAISSGHSEKKSMMQIFSISGRHCAWLLLASCLSFLAQQPAYASKDWLELRAYRSAKASSSMLLGVTSAGHRLVAVGEHGIIVYSDTNGKTWAQADVPVSVTLTAVYFPTPTNGWAVGHDGVILRTMDGGRNWVKQFDGNKANTMIVEAAEKRVQDARKPGQSPTVLKGAESALEDARAGAKFGPSHPLLDVWFKNEAEGIAIGSFGQIFHTSNGGERWELWADRLNNPDGLHYNSISVTASGLLLIAGEGGKVYRSGDAGRSWDTLETGYPGQLYGVVGIANKTGSEVLVAFGFGGHVFRSTDKGASWNPVVVETKKSVVAGTVLPGGTLVLVTQVGRLLRSDDEGRSFKSAGASASTSVAAMTLIASDGSVIFAGTNGTKIVSMNNARKVKQP